MKFPKEHQDYTIVALFFIATRIVASWGFGIVFDERPLDHYWQYIDPELLRHRLLQSLYYLHDQPPLFNLYLGVTLKLFPLRHALAFKATFLALGLASSLALVATLGRLGVGRKAAVFLTCLFIANPVRIEYENWLFYEYPTACCLLLAAACLRRFLASGYRRRGIAFFSLLAGVACMRGLLDLSWFLATAAALALRAGRDWKAVARAAALPLAFILIVYLKNFWVFDSFSTGAAQVGSILARHVTQELPGPVLDDLVRRRRISGISELPQFAPISRYAPYGLTPRATGIPILDAPRKGNGAVNPHNLIYLTVGEIDRRDALRVLRHHGLEIMEIRLRSLLRDYFLPSDRCFPYYGKGTDRQWAEWKGIYRMLVLGEFRPGRPWSSMIGLPVLFAYACWRGGKGLCGSRGPRPAEVRGGLAVFILITIGSNFLSELFLGADHPRYRFMVDPLYLLLLGMLLSEARAAMTRRNAGRPRHHVCNTTRANWSP